MNSAVFALALVVCITAAPRAGSAAPQDSNVYASDPKHLWNVLNATLFVRTGADGTAYGSNELDVLYWRGTDHL